MKIAVYILAVSWAFFASGLSFAAEMKVGGEFKTTAMWYDNWNGQDAGSDNVSEDDFSIRTRARFIFRYSASDSLSAVIRLQYGASGGGMTWGDPNSGGQIDTDANNIIYIRRLYLEFKWPDTKVLFQAGKLALSMPNQFGSPVLGADAATFAVSSPITGNVSVAAGFARAVDLNRSGETGSSVRDEWDHVYLSLPLKFDGLQVTPFGDLSFLGNGIPPSYVLGGYTGGIKTPGGTVYEDDYVYPWWAGLSLKMTALDPWTVQGDFNYGQISDGDSVNDRSGWFADLAVSYKGLDFMVPQLMGMYSSGEDDDVGNGSERMPVVRDDWVFGTWYYGGSDLLSGDLTTSEMAAGTWCAGLGLTEMTFIDKLSHDLYVLYIAGTNDSGILDKAPKSLKHLVELTDEDYLVEIDFNHKYMIYEQLAAILELTYVFNGIDEKVWGIADESDIWKIGLGLNYNF
jgi:hypothetical protein